MNESLKSIYKKYNGKTLDDGLSSVSKEYNNYQNALKRTMAKLAIELGAELVSFTKGHYFESIVFHRNGHYVYLHHESLNRTYIDFDNGYGKFDLSCYNGRQSWYARTMAHAKDWTGGCNNWDFNWETLPNKIDKLLNTEHIKF